LTEFDVQNILKIIAHWLYYENN